MSGMATTKTREALPISQAQVDEATTIAYDACRTLGIDATVTVGPAYDPEFQPHRMALLEVIIPQGAPPDAFLNLLAMIGNGLTARGLQWPEAPIQLLVW